MHLNRVRVKRVGQGEDAAAWVKALEDPDWLKSSQVLKQEGGSWVRRATLRERDVVVKVRALNSLSRRIKSFLGVGHADKHWRGAETLSKIGVPTARPLVIARAAVDRVDSELLVLEYIPGGSLLEVMDAIARGAGPGVKMQHAIANAVGKQVRAIEEAGWSNRDHKPSNLIVIEGVDEIMRIAVIDCVGIRHFRSAPMFGMPISLVLEPLGCGVLPRRALLMRALRAWNANRDAEFEKLIHPISSAHSAWMAIEDLVRKHGDPRPKVNPLADR